MCITPRLVGHCTARERRGLISLGAHTHVLVASKQEASKRDRATCQHQALTETETVMTCLHRGIGCRAFDPFDPSPPSSKQAKGEKIGSPFFISIIKTWGGPVAPKAPCEPCGFTPLKNYQNGCAKYTPFKLEAEEAISRGGDAKMNQRGKHEGRKHRRRVGRAIPRDDFQVLPEAFHATSGSAAHTRWLLRT